MTTRIAAAPELTPAQARRERERAEARASILTAARELARQQGWGALTMRALADRIEYSANFAYRYFSSRDEILLALAREGFVQLGQAMGAAGQTQQLAGRPVSAVHADAVRRAVHAYLEFALAEPDLYQLMYGAGGTHVPTRDTWPDEKAVGDLLAGLLAAAGDPEPTRHVLQLWATAHGLVTLSAADRLGIDAVGQHAVLDDAITACLARSG